MSGVVVSLKKKLISTRGWWPSRARYAEVTTTAVAMSVSTHQSSRCNCLHMMRLLTTFFFFFQAEDGIRDFHVTGVQTLCSSDLHHGDRLRRHAVQIGHAVALADRDRD